MAQIANADRHRNAGVEATGATSVCERWMASPVACQIIWIECGVGKGPNADERKKAIEANHKNAARDATTETRAGARRRRSPQATTVLAPAATNAVAKISPVRKSRPSGRDAATTSAATPSSDGRARLRSSLAIRHGTDLGSRPSERAIRRG